MAAMTSFLYAASQCQKDSVVLEQFLHALLRLIYKEFMAIRCNHSIHVTADMIMLCLNSEPIGPSLSNTGTSTSFQDKET